MAKLLITFMIPMFLLACGRNSENASNNFDATPTDAKTTEQIEAEAIQHGIAIRLGTKSWSSGAYFTPITISYGAVGNTDSELASAIAILKTYYAAVLKKYELSSDERNDRLEVINKTMTTLQTQRTELLLKKNCPPAQ